MKKTVLLVGLLCSATVFASDDLKSMMKQMKLDFNHAAEATSVEEMQTAVNKFAQLVHQAQQGDYPQEKQALYFEGFEKLSLSIEAINHDLQQGDLEAAKQELRTIDALREEYHDKRNPSIWSKLFG